MQGKYAVKTLNLASRNFMALPGARQKIHDAVSSLPRWISGAGLIDLMEKFFQRGDRTSSQIWSRLSFEFIRMKIGKYRLGKREVGHIHGDYPWPA
jgi:hypothetical protein